MLAWPGEPHWLSHDDNRAVMENNMRHTTQGNTTKQQNLAHVGYDTNGLAELSIARRGQQRIQTNP
jgi:hypothetical protein